MWVAHLLASHPRGSPSWPPARHSSPSSRWCSVPLRRRTGPRAGLRPLDHSECQAPLINAYTWLQRDTSVLAKALSRKDDQPHPLAIAVSFKSGSLQGLAEVRCKDRAFSHWLLKEACRERPLGAPSACGALRNGDGALKRSRRVECSPPLSIIVARIRVPCDLAFLRVALCISQT